MSRRRGGGRGGRQGWEKLSLAPRAAARSRVVIAFAALTLLTCLLFLPALRPGTAFFFRDVSQNHEPFRRLTTSIIAGGEMPLWNPYRGAGQPLLANPNALVLHPTTFLFLLLPLQAAMKLSVIAQILLAAFSTWLLLRDMGTSRVGALVGGCLFAFSGFMLSLGNLLNLLDSAAFMPLTLWLWSRAISRRFSPWGPLAACSLAVQLLAGGPAILLCTVLSLPALHWSFPPARRPVPGAGLGARSASLAGVAALAAALAMVGLLPGIELLVRSERGAGFEMAQAMKWSLPPAALIESVMPGWFGDPTRVGPTHFWGSGVHDAGLPFILSIHLGAAALMLAVLGMAPAWRGSSRRRKEAIALGLLGLGGLVMSLGRFLPIYPLLVAVVSPLESVRYPVKYYLMTAWAVSLLAARGYDDAAGGGEDMRGRRARILPALLVPAGCLLAAITAWALFPGWLKIPHALATPDVLAAIGRGLARSASFGLAEGALMILLLYSARARPAVARIGLAVVPVGALMLSGAGLNPVAPAGFYDEPPLLSPILDEPDHQSRLWSQPRPPGFAFRTPAAANADSLLWGFRWDRMTLRNATYFAQGYRFAYDRGNERLDVTPGALVGKRLYGGVGGSVPAPVASRLLSVAAVGQLITYGGLDLPGMHEQGRLEGESNIPVVILRNNQAVERAHVVPRAEVLPDGNEAMRRLQDASFDPRRSVILEKEGRDRPGRADSGTEEMGSARIVEDLATRVRVQATLSRPGYLVLSDTYYPGWAVTVDGRPGEILRADVMFRAVALQAGEHDVLFTYRPATLAWGAAASAGGLLLAIGLAVVPRRR